MSVSTTSAIGTGSLGFGLLLGFALLYVVYRGILLARTALRNWRAEQARYRDAALEGSALVRLSGMVGLPLNWVRFGLTTMFLRGELPSYITPRFLTGRASTVMERINLERGEQAATTTMYVERGISLLEKLEPAL